MSQATCSYTNDHPQPITDISGSTAVIMMIILAVLNVGVIFEGCWSCQIKIKGHPAKMMDIVMFYLTACLSLMTAILYCFSWAFIHEQKCFYYVI